MRKIDGVTMVFVYLPDWGNDYKWWIWDTYKMKLINYNHGGFEIDKDALYWKTAIKHPEILSWHQLYKLYGVNPIEADIYDFDLWISPDGEFWDGNSHMVTARKVVDIYYGLDMDDDYSGECETYLLSKGWLKATKSAMWPYYVKDNTKRQWNTTKKAYATLIVYCELHKLEIPTNIKFID